MNEHVINIFNKGMSYDIENRAESKETYQLGENVRLYSHDGTLSASSIKGTTEIYRNLAIVKYLGAYSFEDQFVALVKYDLDYSDGVTQGTHKEYVTVDQQKNYAFGGKHANGFNLQAGLVEETILDSTINDNIPIGEIDDSNVSCIDEAEELDLTKYYTNSPLLTIPNYQACTFSSDDLVPENNKDLADAILVVTKEEDGSLTKEIVWIGHLNLDIDRKIRIIGSDENSSFRRVYFTDALNPLRTFNLKDNNLPYKKSNTFDLIQPVNLLQPEVTDISNSGVLPAMSVQYAFRLTTAEGQVSLFSPFSKVIRVVKDSEPTTYRGGDVSEGTNKAVTVSCPIPNSSSYAQVECIAIEYETTGTPTGIKTLGIKNARDITTFVHSGNEGDFDNTLTYADLLANSQTEPYCNDISINQNRFIKGGLRNDPYPVSIKFIEDLFLLKGYADDGRTHDCLINPEPSKYKYLSAGNSNQLYSISKVQYTDIQTFGNSTILFTDSETGNQITKKLVSSSAEYVDLIKEVYDWLILPGNLDSFDDVKAEYIGGSIVLSPIAVNSTNNIGRYRITSSSKQSIINFENEYVLNTDAVNTDTLVHGAQSYGFNEGTGIRLSWRTERDLLMSKSDELFNSGSMFPIEAPSLKKSWMKGEIYRVAITLYKNGSPLFAIPLGDIQVPPIGDPRLWLDENGEKRGFQSFLFTLKHKNQSIDGDGLYANRTVLRAEVRLGCDLKDFADSYQIQYVERTETNRTIISQGISAPLMRINKFKDINLSSESKAPNVFRKWTLPYMGGPIIERNGLEAYDTYGEGFEETDSDNNEVNKRRVMVNRSLLYFDSPDFIHGKTSLALVSSAKARVIGRLKTDHNRQRLVNMGIAQKDDPFKNPTDKVFSRKLWEGGKDKTPTAVFADSERNYHPYWVDCSVFSRFERHESLHEISKFSEIGNGLIAPASALGTTHEVSNNALSLGDPAFFYSSELRRGLIHGDLLTGSNQTMSTEFMQSCNQSAGYRTLVIKTEDDLYTDALAGNEVINMECNYHDGNRLGTKPATDSHVLINLTLDNEETVYGGRTKYALSRNIYTPISNVVPINPSTNQAQVTHSEGDVYVSLYIRNKNSWQKHLEFEEIKGMRNHNNPYAKDKYNKDEFNRPAAWNYAVVLETEVEDKLSSAEKQYRNEVPLDFSQELQEFINPAYLVTNNAKSFVPRPYNFIDDPVQSNIIAGSQIKLSGDFYDAFSVFRPNDFYALEKKYGDITNLISHKKQLYAIQHLATNVVIQDPKDYIKTEGSAATIQMIQGTGTVFHNHDIVSKYGTSIRRNAFLGEDTFYFFDENRVEFVRGVEPMLKKTLNHLSFKDLLGSRKILDANGYFDADAYNEACITLRLDDNSALTLSYNEALQVFNGYFGYNNEIFINFDEKIYTPIWTAENDLHQLNSGAYLNIFNHNQNMKVGIIVNAGTEKVKIFRGIEALLNTNYPVKSFKIYDNIDKTDVRTINGDHFRYKIREGKHTVPLLNADDRSPMRGEYAYIEVEIEPQDGKKIDLFALKTFIRESKI